jgi:hypothetical protein
MARRLPFRWAASACVRSPGVSHPPRVRNAWEAPTPFREIVNLVSAAGGRCSWPSLQVQLERLLRPIVSRPNKRLDGSSTGRRRLYWSAGSNPVRAALGRRDLSNPQARRRRAVCWLLGWQQCCIAAHVTRTQGGTTSPHFALIPTSPAGSPRLHPYPSVHRDDLWASVSRDAEIECLNSTLASAKQQPASGTRRNPSPLMYLWPAGLSVRPPRGIRTFMIPPATRPAECCISL